MASEFLADIDAFVAQFGLGLVADPEKGQRTVAARGFKRGDTLLAIRPLYGFPIRRGEQEESEEGGSVDDAEGAKKASVVQPEDRCANCFDLLPSKRPRCSQCHAAQYCSMPCLTEHWNTRHHFECKRHDASTANKLASKIKPMYRPYLRMAIGVGKTVSEVARRRHSAQKSGKPANALVPKWLQIQTAAWERLVDHKEMHPPHVLKQYSEIASVLANESMDDLAFSLSNPDSPKHDAVQALCRFGCNNFVAYSQQMRASGHLCNPLASLLFNHSCLQNATFVYTRTGEQVIIALEDIQEGQEITISYTDGLRPRTERRKTLEAVYFFACKCSRCTGNSPSAQIDALLDRAGSLNTANNDGGIIPRNIPTDFADQPSIESWVQNTVNGLIDQALNTGGSSSTFPQLCLDSVEQLPPSEFSFAAYKHWLECQDECIENLTASHDSAGCMWGWACVSSLYVLAFYAMVYPPFHPLVGLQCLESAKLAWNALQQSYSAKEWSGLLITEIFVKNLASTAQTILDTTRDPSCTAACVHEKQVALLLSQIG